MASQDTMQPSFTLDPIEPLLGVKEAAYLLGISVKTLRDWIQERKIDYVKAGTRVMIRPDTIRDFVSKNTHRAKSR
jgi:excisionase family DNA binding protein